MNIKLLVDMNLSEEWIGWLRNRSWDALHWASVGDPKASDSVIMAWARTNGYVVFTHDLDFGTLLALTNAQGPSVIQVRAQDVFPEHLGPFVVAALQQHQRALENGALVVVDESTCRVRVLPITLS